MSVNINIPSNENSLTITINIGNKPGATVEMATALTGNAEALELAKKAELEQNMDYSDCKGFDSSFMGFETPLPELGKQLKRKVVRCIHDSSMFVLDYYNYSIIHHAVRRMPIISAINIDGNPNKRKDEQDRKDSWLRDNRIDFDLQLNDEFYKKSNFDKGHMSRREDADWGKTEAIAYQNANFTCMYTNACPQVPDLNRAVFGYHGLWGQLEQHILEKGVKEESGETTKICVYNGPIFIPTDPVFKGVQIPMRFFKVVVWMNEANEKKTTAFILSQEDLVGGIEFEELQYNLIFKEHQCSLEYLEGLADLTFTGIRDWDTFKNDGPGAKGVKALDKQSLELLVTENTSKQ